MIYIVAWIDPSGQERSERMNGLCDANRLAACIRSEAEADGVWIDVRVTEAVR